MVALRIELSATWLSAAFGQPALGYRQSGWQDSNLRLRAPTTMLRTVPGGSAATLRPVVAFSQNGRDQSAGWPIGARTGDLLHPEQARYPGFATF